LNKSERNLQLFSEQLSASA